MPAATILRSFTRSPIDYHDSVQVKGTPFSMTTAIIKFNNFWTIEIPQGYSLFVTHPVNRGSSRSPRLPVSSTLTCTSTVCKFPRAVE